MTDIAAAGYFGYWGKAKKDPEHPGPDYHLLAYHSLDVAAVGWHLLNPENKLCQELAEFIQLTPAQLQRLFTFALILHDFGKFSGAFQALKVFDTAALHQFKVRRPYDGAKARHDMLGWVLWQIALEEGLDLPKLTRQTLPKAVLDKALCTLFDTTWGHHGKPIRPGRLGELEDHLVDANILHAKNFIEEAAQLLQPEWPAAFFTAEVQSCFRQISWHLAGVAILADWLGSDTRFFPYKTEVISLAEYWPDTLARAEQAIAATDLFKAFSVQPFSGFQQQFGFIPTPLQQWAANVPIADGPQLFILEDITGSGKTEAALTLTQRIMAAGQAEGFYFGLPSMATSNAMFKRVTSHYQQMYQQNAPSIVLAHGARDMEQSFRDILLPNRTADASYQADEQTATAICNEWFADSRKKALLAPVGVGTLDQALLAVLPRRHQALRMIGLHRKVLIFDEVHAADEYMLVLLQDLLQLHARQGGSVILLTATLAQQQRQQLVKRWLEVLGQSSHCDDNNAFPLATQVSVAGVQQMALTSRADVCRTLSVSFLHTVIDCVVTIATAVAKGQSVVWICN
ncbi:MAG: CRISPR-associated endonuclease Cas3'', partial [Gammaproteobacteria bacterium]|nr:CRISPR-associated endonuclease Cas3'' [Gammaproteobacteria bacterium]